MKISNFHSFLLQILILALLHGFTFALKKSYIVTLGAHSHEVHPKDVDVEKVKLSHHQLLGSVLRSKSRAQRKLHYSYAHHLNAFSAQLSQREAAKLARHPDVLSVSESTKVTVETTHSWEFLNFEKNGQALPDSLWEQANYGEDMIIGGIDTGVWPESLSYNDEGLGPIPAKYRGGPCDLDPKQGPTCNRKLIGAGIYNKAYGAECEEHVRANVIVEDISLKDCYNASARDEFDHGTHTLSVAGGSFVPGANMFGQAKGTAKGGAPRARVIAYNVKSTYYQFRTPNGSLEDAHHFHDADRMAAVDDAIASGVDVLTMSLSNLYFEYNVDVVSIAAFHAVKRGIVFVAAVGNAGADPGTAKNLSPWMLTVGSGTIDREFVSYVVLGNNQRFRGIGLYEKNLVPEMQYPLITGLEAKAPGASDENATACRINSVDLEKIKGKILICKNHRGGDSSFVAQEGGAIGLISIYPNPTKKILLQIEGATTLVPSAMVLASDGDAILAYKNSTSNPTAYITPLETEIGHFRPDPVVAPYSARGPNRIEPSILRPDVIAPGIDILGASCLVRGPINPHQFPDVPDNRRLPYLVMSGTSFATPHVAGIVTLLKKIHPDWSPSAIKSALMTTAKTTQWINTTEPLINQTLTRMTPFDIGAGHVQAKQAADPGLVYDLTTEDYLNFLCARGYNESSLRLFHDQPYPCPPGIQLLDFNYPAITIPNLEASLTVTRKLKNVGTPGTYTSKVNPPPGINVSVDPPSLKFEKVGEEQVFRVNFTPTGAKTDKYEFGELIWSDGTHFVKSPLSVKH